MFKIFFASIFLSVSTLSWALHTIDPVTLSRSEEVGTNYCLLDINGKGDAAVMWISTNKEKEIVQISTKTLNTEWTSPENISFPEEDIWSPKLNVSPLGNISCSWNVEIGSKTGYQLNQKIGDLPWSGPRYFIAESDIEVLSLPRRNKSEKNRIKDPQFSWSSYKFHITCGEKVFVLWKRTTFQEGTSIVELKGSWREDLQGSSPELICTSSGNTIGLWDIKGAFGKDKEGALVWEKSEIIEDEYHRSIHAVAYLHGEWSSVIDLSQEEERGAEPSIAADEDGNTLIAWELKREKIRSLGVAYKKAGQSKFTRIGLPYIVGKNLHPEISYDNRGHFVIGWVNYHKKQHRIYGAQFSIEAEVLSQPTLLSPAEGDCWGYSLAFSPSGQGILAWVLSSGRYVENIQVANLIVD